MAETLDNIKSYLQSKLWQLGGFTAASRDYRFKHRKALLNSEDPVTAERNFIAERCQHLYWNDLIAQNGVKSFATNVGVLGVIFADESGAEEPFWTEAWEYFTKNCNYDGHGNFASFQTMGLQTFAVTGEFFARRVASIKHPYVPFELEALPTRNIPIEYSNYLDYVFNGIVFEDGKPFSYLVKPYEKDINAVWEATKTYPYGYEVISADKMLHVWDKVFPEQKRGVPLLTAAAMELWNRQDLSQAVITQSVNSASLAYAIKPQQGNFTGVKQNPIMNVGKGKKTETHLPEQSGEAVPFLKEAEINFYQSEAGSFLHGNADITLLQSQGIQTGINEMLGNLQQMIAACLYSASFQVDGDCTKYNYSSMRAALTSIESKVRIFRAGVTEPQLVMKVVEWWIEAMLVLHPERTRPKIAIRYPRNAIANLLEQMRAYEVALENSILPISQIFDEMDVNVAEFNSPTQKMWTEMRRTLKDMEKTQVSPSSDLNN